MNAQEYYLSLNKPSWAPDPAVFGQVWSALYPIIIGVNIYVLYLVSREKISKRVALPFWLNVFFNLIFTPIQFGLRNNALAMIDVLLILVTIIWAMIAVYPYSRAVAALYVPYLIWVSIASVLQLSITIMN